ncbi:gas vesicle structural protein [Streptomyces viridochromogenes DSM 40736]|uniref:Gas vesicle protein A n=2 Tax=Streptomyces TaxID=1883 RepID=D9X1N6_STRVT|nr:gas vesicle structural protein [Streptomyces viridochromogenes DSM 40736]
MNTHATTPVPTGGTRTDSRERKRTVTVMTQSGGIQPAATSSGSGTAGLFDILELILDRGLVIDVFVRVSLVGIEILKIDIRIVIASVDTYLRFAEACNRLDLEAGRKAPDKLTDIVGNLVESGARGKTSGAIGGAIDAIGDIFDRDDKDREDER